MVSIAASVVDGTSLAPIMDAVDSRTTSDTVDAGSEDVPEIEETAVADADSMLLVLLLEMSLLNVEIELSLATVSSLVD